MPHERPLHNPVRATRLMIEREHARMIGIIEPPIAPGADAGAGGRDPDPLPPTSLTAVVVPINGVDYLVHHAVAAELTRLRSAISGSVVIVAHAMKMRDEAITLVGEAVGRSTQATRCADQGRSWLERSNALLDSVKQEPVTS